MKHPPRKLPAAMSLGAAATATAAAAWLAFVPSAPPKAEPAENALVTVPEIPETFGADAETAAARILSRPLFVEGRQAIVADGGNDALGDLRLAGTISTATVKKALFRKADETGVAGRGRWVGIGEEAAGWRIVAVESGAVVLQRGGEQIVLTVSKRKSLTPKQISQKRAATPILPSAIAKPSPAEIDARQEKLNEALAKLGESGFYGTEDE